MITRLRISPGKIPVSLLLALGLVTALTLARFNQSLWSDEASSVWFSRLPIHSLLTSLCDPHPPGYYLFLQAWRVAGEGEAWLRVPSWLAALLSVGLIYRFAQDQFDSTTATWAALLLALQPLHTWYASEVRMYALTQAAGVLAVWLGWRVITRAATWRGWLAYALATEAALWLDYSALFPLALLQLIWLARGRPHVRRWLGLHAAIALPLIGWWLTSNQRWSLSNSYQPIFIAVQAGKWGINLTPDQADHLLQIGVAGLAAGGIALALYWPRRSQRWSSIVRGIGAAAWLGLLVFSALPLAFTIKRLIVVVAPYAALMAAQVLSRWPRPKSFAVGAASLLAAVIALGTLQRDPWRTVVQNLAASPPATVWVDELSAPAFDYYWRRFDPDNGTHWAPLIGRNLPALPTLTPAPNGPLWIITEETAYRRLIALLPIEFGSQYQALDQQATHSIRLYRYQRRLQPTDSPPMPDRTPTDEWGLRLPSPLDTCTR
jgi:4-amino-4-deoxy-L-arabinose transferase-like glycosyltransferase